MLEWFGIEFPDRVVKVEATPSSTVLLVHISTVRSLWNVLLAQGPPDLRKRRLALQFRDYFGRVVGRCREKVRLKDGLNCDARVLRMRYSSQDWVRRLCLHGSAQGIHKHGCCTLRGASVHLGIHKTLAGLSLDKCPENGNIHPALSLAERACLFAASTPLHAQTGFLSLREVWGALHRCQRARTR